MLTPAQVAAWTEAALSHLDDLAGFILWEEDCPIPVRFCDGHAVHQGDARELCEQFLTVAEALAQESRQGPGEDGTIVPTQALFISLYCLIANSERIYIPQTEAR
ncbi:MAG: hypothetical protein L6R45_10265 [Anaerolineae bacterium]|nr:hypothetical protein [Anaerolineae bacterium]